MKRKHKRIKQNAIVLGVFILLLYGLYSIVDQQLLFKRHNEEIAGKEKEIQALEEEIRELETMRDWNGDLTFVEEYARKKGLEPTDLTPVPIEGMAEYEKEKTEN